MSRLLIKGGRVLTMAGQNHPTADVLVEDGWVTEIAPTLRGRGAEVIDATESIVMPGFVDAHRHAWRSLVKHLVDAPSSDVGSDLAPDDLYAATLLGLLASAEAGITSVVDWCEVASTAEHVEAALSAHADAGLRSVFVLGAASSDWRDALRRLAEAQPPDLQTLAAGLPDPVPADPDATVADLGLARELGLRSHVHAGTAVDGAGVVAELGHRGALGDDVTVVHGTRLGPADLDAVAAAGASVVLTPSTEMAEGLGLPPVQQLLDRDIRPGLGVDAERIAPGDMFAQMRATISLQHARYFDLKLVGKAGLPNLLTTREVIRYATIDSARAAGLGDRTGSLEPGKRADVLVLRTDRPNIFPINDPIGAVVWGMDTSNVDWVLVAGEPVVADGALVAGTDRVRELVGTAQHRVAAAAGRPDGSGA